MIKHVVLYILKDKSQSNKMLVKQNLLSMNGKIDVLKTIEVGIDKMNSDRSCDISLICTFDNYDDLLTYIDHPVHFPIKVFMKTVVEKAISCDYEV